MVLAWDNPRERSPTRCLGDTANRAVSSIGGRFLVGRGHHRRVRPLLSAFTRRVLT
jgi:hypothetical protein